MMDEDPPRLSVTEPLAAAGQVLSQLAASLYQIRQTREASAERHALPRPATRHALAADQSRGSRTPASIIAAERHLSDLPLALVDQIRADPAWPALAVRLGDVARAGHEPSHVLRHVADLREFHTAESAAEVLHWRLGQFLDANPTYTRGWEAQARTADALADQARAAAAETATRPDDLATPQTDEHNAAASEHHTDVANQANATTHASSIRAAAIAANRVFVVTTPPRPVTRTRATTATRPAPTQTPRRSR